MAVMTTEPTTPAERRGRYPREFRRDSAALVTPNSDQLCLSAGKGTLLTLLRNGGGWPFSAGQRNG